MTDRIVERSYTHPFLGDEPRLLYYHQACWNTHCPPELADLAEGTVYDAIRGTVRLVQAQEVPIGTRCHHCTDVISSALGNAVPGYPGDFP